MVTASEEERGILSEIPRDYRWEKTVIIPGKFAFLALPFEKQSKNGICVASSALNVISYIDPDIKLDQTELFKMFNGGVAGANDAQLVNGLANLGFRVTPVVCKGTQPKDLIASIQASLEDDHPIVAFKPGHAITIIGFDKEAKKIIAWNQREESPSVNGMPKGAFTISEATVSGYFDMLFFIGKQGTPASATEQTQINSVLGGITGLKKFTISNRASREDIRAYASHAIPQAIKTQLRSGKTVIILKGDEVKVVSDPNINIPKEKADPWSTSPSTQKDQPVTLTNPKDGSTKQISLRNLANEIAVSCNATFFSADGNHTGK